MLPHVIDQIAFGYKFFFANFTGVGLHTMMFNPENKSFYLSYFTSNAYLMCLLIEVL